MTLYLKYRPQKFSDVTGQENVVTTLSHALRTNSVTHAYLFGGARGTGKTSLARIIAKAINCKNLKDAFEPCDTCLTCEGVREGRLVDLIEIDAASNRGIDEIRDLKEKIMFAPTQGKAKVYIIDEVHMLTKEAFNALLKTLEEPPAHAYFILATTEVHKIPETILSRCQQFNFRKITDSDIFERLKTVAELEKLEAEEEALRQIAIQAHGGLRDALGLLEQMTLDGKVTLAHVSQALGLSSLSLLTEFMGALEKKEVHRGLEILHEIGRSGLSLTQFLTELVGKMRESMLAEVKNPEEAVKWMRRIDIFSQARVQLTSALIPELPLEMALLKACDFEISNKSTPLAAAAKITGFFKKETPAPEKQAEISGEALNLTVIKSKWPEVLRRIETPFVRTSLNDGEPIAYEEGRIHLVFKSTSMMEKVQNPNNQTGVIKAMEEVFAQKITLKFELKKITLPDVSVIDMAKEVFGG
jgi:DNA polymerase-3 subunit gamma/tau